MPFPATPELVALLNSATQGVSIPVVTITLRDGTVLRWARRDSDVAFGGVTWLAHGKGGRPLIKAYRWRMPVGLDEIGTCEMTLDCGDSAVLGGKRLTLAAAQGAFAGASLLLERVYKATPEGAAVGKLFRFKGDIISAPPTSNFVTLSVETAAAKLKATVLPKALISASCQNALFDPVCGLNRAAHTTAKTVAAGSTRTLVQLQGTTATGHYDNGTIVFLTGACAGERRGVRAWTSPGTAELTFPLPVAPSAGDSAELTTGCDLTTGSKGCGRYANLARFRAHPHIPREA